MRGAAVAGASVAGPCVCVRALVCACVHVCVWRVCVCGRACVARASIRARRVWGGAHLFQ